MDHLLTLGKATVGRGFKREIVTVLLIIKVKDWATKQKKERDVPICSGLNGSPGTCECDLIWKKGSLQK